MCASDEAEIWQDAMGGVGVCPTPATAKAASISDAGEKPVLKRMQSRTAC